MSDVLKGGVEVNSNWFKFTKVGDFIKGTLISKDFKKSNQPTFPNQWVYQIKTEDGQVWNVGISEKKTGTVARVNKCQIGEIVGIVFESEGESAIKGGQKAKNLKVLSFGMDANYTAEQEVDLDDVAF